MGIAIREFNPELEPEVLTDKDEVKELPCRKCGRRCVVTRFASPHKTECTRCRAGQSAPASQPETTSGVTLTTPSAPPTDELEINTSLEPDVLTDKDPVKMVACRKCRRACVVTVFATPSKVECTTCRGNTKSAQREQTLIKQAHTADPATLANLADGLINPAFRTVPLCPFDPEHNMVLKSITHSPNYGPRHLVRYDKGIPIYDQKTGESVVYQCDECFTTVNFSTMHPVNLIPQNEVREVIKTGGSILAEKLGVRDEAA